LQMKGLKIDGNLIIKNYWCTGHQGDDGIYM
jgi:hypothetical protein